MSLAAGGLFFAGSASTAAGAAPLPETKPVAQCSAADLRGDPRLGPAKLPFFGEVGEELDAYRRTGGHSIRQFLGTWWNPAAAFSRFPGIPGDWVFPPSDGYYLNPDGTPLRSVTTLRPGQQIDRYGLPRGSFLSPRGTDYGRRSLPPSNLDDTVNPGSCNYHVYQVARAFQAFTGPIRPWFDQPGDGRQYQVVCVLVPGSVDSDLCDQTTGNLRIQYLLDQGYLVEVPAGDSSTL